MTLNRIQLVFAALVLLLLCVSAFLLGSVLSQGNLSPREVHTPDGRTIICVASDAGGVNCDWNTPY